MLSLQKFIVVGFVLLSGGVYSAHSQVRASIPCNPADLVSAINAANDTPEMDTLNLTPNCIYKFSVGDATNADSALPRIATPITINGSGAIIERDSSAAANFRLFFVSTGDLTLNNITVRSGSSAGSGGGILNDNGTLTLNNSIVSGNNADGNGGGIRNEDGALTVINSVVSGNTSGNEGGGIWNSFTGTVMVINSAITGNDAGGDDGGGIYNGNSSTATVTVIASTLSGNSALNDGGGLFNGGGIATLINSVVSGNSATNGGGSYNGNAAMMINSLISGNTAASGGGIYNASGQMFLNNATITGNSATTAGGGIFNGAPLIVTNSIIWENNIQLSGLAPSVSYSIVQGALYPGDGNSLADPQFVSPVSHTLAPATDGDYHLKTISPAKNTGSNAAVPEDITDLDGDGDFTEKIPYDLDNGPRIEDGTVDKGAYEWPMDVELLNNRDFELDDNTNKVPDGWVVKNPTSDKLKCNKPDKSFSFAGLCAFRFKGGLGESAKLQQNVDIDDISFAAGDTLILRAYFNGSVAAVKAKFMVKVKYDSVDVADKSSATVGATPGYIMVTVDELALLGPDVGQIKVMVKHKSATGKLYVDGASLHLTRNSLRLVRADVLPPTAPDGMRGFN